MGSQTRENEKFYRLVWPHRLAVLRTARFLERDQSLAEDLAQETMLKAFRAMDQLGEETSAIAWLLSILRNTQIDRLRSQATRRAHETLDPISLNEAEARQSNGAEANLADAEQIMEQFSDGEVINGLRSVPDDIRWTLLLVDVEGLNQHDAATVLDVPIGTVKSRLHRGREMLRVVLTTRARELRMIP